MKLKNLLLLIFIISTVSTFAQKVDTLNVNQTLELINSDNSIIFIDCRDSVSFKSGHLPRAIHLDVYDDNFAQKLQLFDKNKVYLIYCRTNGRSKNMSEQMIANGFTRIYLFESGFLKWKESDYPIEIE